MTMNMENKMKNKMKNTREKMMCEQATGCSQKGKLVFYDEGGDKISLAEAKDLIQSNQPVEVPGAGAGSFREVFTSLGFEEVETIDTTSSAGDWTIGVKNEYVWFVAWQENRYPYHGFRYCVSDYVMPCSTFEELCKEVEEE